MTTIKETLEEIQKLQKELSKEVVGQTMDARFLNEINNFVGVYYFDLLAHACMNSLESEIHKGKYPSGFVAYRNISKQDDAYKELIKLNSIGGLFSVWAKFEQFIYRHVSSTGNVINLSPQPWLGQANPGLERSVTAAPSPILLPNSAHMRP